MHFWTAYAVVALSVASKAWGAAGAEGHGSITDLIAPTFNVVILLGALVLATKNQLKSYFDKKSEDVANTLERASIKSQEARMMLETQKRKMASLDADVKNIHAQSEAEVISFEQKLALELSEKSKKLKADAEAKIVADKKAMMDEVSAELLEQVVAKTKSTIRDNKEYQAKVSNKMLQGLQ
jgi:F0F1-type ATP synthase membrane subunit b/b'